MKHYRNVVLLLILFIFVSGCSSLYQEESLTSHYCDNIDKLSWQDDTLYNVTYQCIPSGWESFFLDSEVKTQVKTISGALAKQVKEGWEISPNIGSTFKALYMVEPSQAKAVILGQDPAPQPGLATGLSFSLPSGTPTSDVASVQRVFLEVNNQGFCTDLNDGDASAWAENKVLLLNMALTIPCPKGKFCKIAKHVPLWEDFTGKLMSYIDTLEQPMSFILWGSKAKAYSHTVKNPLHRTFEGGHPSPKAPSASFFCKNYFHCANQWLVENNSSPVDWNLSKQCKQKPCCIWEWHSDTRSSSCEHKCEEQACELPQK